MSDQQQASKERARREPPVTAAECASIALREYGYWRSAGSADGAELDAAIVSIGGVAAAANIHAAILMGPQAPWHLSAEPAPASPLAELLASIEALLPLARAGRVYAAATAEPPALPGESIDSIERAEELLARFRACIRKPADELTDAWIVSELSAGLEDGVGADRPKPEELEI